MTQKGQLIRAGVEKLNEKQFSRASSQILGATVCHGSRPKQPGYLKMAVKLNHIDIDR
jgi:hypothetical protein